MAFVCLRALGGNAAFAQIRFDIRLPNDPLRRWSVATVPKVGDAATIRFVVISQYSVVEAGVTIDGTTVPATVIDGGPNTFAAVNELRTAEFVSLNGNFSPPPPGGKTIWVADYRLHVAEICTLG